MKSLSLDCKGEMMRIVQLNTRDIGGGAAKIAWELFSAYRDRGYGSYLAVGQKRSDDPNVIALPNERTKSWIRFCWRLSRSLERRQRCKRVTSLLGGLARTLASPGRSLDFQLGVEDTRYRGTRRLFSMFGQHPDIIHGHNLHGHYFDLRALPWLSQQLPVILTLHDAWLLAGHCAHSLSCERWRTGCGHCPDLGVYPSIKRDGTAYNWRRKKRIYSRSRFYVATPSRWLLGRVEESMLATAIVDSRVIPNGVDLAVFRQGSRQASRSTLAIPQEARVLLFAANGIRQNPFKDLQVLQDAAAEVAERLHGAAVHFLALGEDRPPERTGRAEIRFIPYQSDPQVVARYYQAADVYVHAARADTFPGAVLEAMACGTPVVATATGGIPEQVEDGETGFLVPEGQPDPLASRILEILSDDALSQKMGDKAAESAHLRFDLRRQVDAYLDWYCELLQGSAGRNLRERARHGA